MGIIATFCVLIGYIIKITIDYQKLKSSHENLNDKVNKLEDDYHKVNELEIKFYQNEKRDVEERENNSKKFDELYNSRNKTNEVLVDLTRTVKDLVTNMDKQFSSQAQQFEKLEKKIDELAKEHRGN